MFNKVLNFWFGSEDSDSSNFGNKPCFILKSINRSDELIRTEFYDLIKDAENNLLSDWIKDKSGKLALIILLDQFKRIIGQNKPYESENSQKCIGISLDIIENNSLQSYSLLEQIFIVLPLITSMDETLARNGFDLLKNIASQSPNKQKPLFFNYVTWAKINIEHFEKYGNYPLFLSKKKSLPKSKKSPGHKKILFLHGLRQSSNKLKKRTAHLAKILQENNVSVTCLNGTHPYNSGQQKNSRIGYAIESQRAWYHSDEKNENYHGLEESIEHLLNHVKLNGPYIGLIGFSQGAVLASIVTKLYPNLFNFVISISGFKARDLKYGSLFSEQEPFDFPSLHIYGKNDQMVSKDRSEEFSKCFKNPIIFEHPDGHFTPLSWPSEKIANFVNDHITSNQCFKFLPDDQLEDKIKKIELALKNNDIFESQMDGLFSSEEAKNLVKSPKFKNLEFTSQDLSIIDSDESLLLLFICAKLAINLDGKNSETYSNTRKILTILLDIQNLFNLPNSQMFSLFSLNWKLLILLCDQCFCDQRPKAADLFSFLIEIFSSQILSDLCFVDEHNGSHLLQNLTSVDQIGSCSSNLSDLALYLPRINSSIDKRSRIAREVATKLNPISDLDSKIKSYNHYRKCLSNICSFNQNKLKSLQKNNPREIFLLAKQDKKVMSCFLDSPLTDSILNPMPEPVDVSSDENMKPLYDWLRKNKNPIFIEDNLKFSRGTVTPDGRLDLCKQVIGTKGVQSLLESICSNQNIDRLLLGNNIVGDQGGSLIAEFIKSGSSPLTIWYIAGNNLTDKGIKPIADALLTDTKVTALWLKRNPLKAQGMVHIGNLMRVNSTISTLDLLNCGLLDTGVEILMQTLGENKTLKHLYLSANGISPVGLNSLKKYWTGHLETLFLGANRIGDEGAKVIGDILKIDTKLSKLNMSSSRIGIDGMKFLAESLENNTSLLSLDLGYMKSSMDLGELGNFIQDEGAEHLAQLIRKNESLMSLNVNHNHISKLGIMKLRDAVRNNDHLIELEFSQHGLFVNQKILKEINKKMNLNRDKLINSRPDFDIEELFIPKHVKDIYSVYRTH